MKLIPSHLTHTTSNAEKKFFKLSSESEGTEEWYCLHSLGVSRHITKREGEIDFLFIGPQGLFVVEVKGGRVHREEGAWKFTDRYGRVTQKRESPFTQARSALYSLKDDIAEKLGPDIHKLVFGYGVAFPDITFQTESPEWDKSMVFDSHSLKLPFKDYLDGLSNYWMSRQRGGKRLDREEMKRIMTLLRGDFEAVRPVSLDVNEAEAGLLELTEEQYGALDAMEENERTTFSGPAGTGKTLLAIEKARRNHARGIKTLFLCFNRLLGIHLNEVIERENLNLVQVNSLHHFFREVISEGGHHHELEQHQDSREFFSEVYPEYFLKSWKQEQAYDELIIDEGQDILTTEYITALDATLKGGFKAGRWSMFLDPETQRDMFVAFDEAIYNELRRNAACFRLTVNCRNTKPIAMQAEVISGFPLGRVKKVNGLPVKYLWYGNDFDQAAQVSETVNNLLKDGVKPEDITILSAKRYQASVAGSGRLRLNAGHYQLGRGRGLLHKNLVACGTIQAYKGLESSIVILTDIEDIDNESIKTVNYVGYTRARTALWVSIDRRLKKKYQEYFAKIAAGGTRK